MRSLSAVLLYLCLGSTAAPISHLKRVDAFGPEGPSYELDRARLPQGANISPEIDLLYDGARQLSDIETNGLSLLDRLLPSEGEVLKPIPEEDSVPEGLPPSKGHETPQLQGVENPASPGPKGAEGLPPTESAASPHPGQGPEGESSPGSSNGPGQEGANNEDPNWTSEEFNFNLIVEGEGEGALSESGRQGSSWKSSGSGAGSYGASGSSDYKLSDYRDSDRSLAAAQVKGQIGGGNVKNFDGGRNDKERNLFSGIKSKYDNLKEVDAVNSNKGNWGGRNRGSDRYIFGTPKDDPKKGPINLGVARHAPNKYDFDQFKQW